MTAWLSSVCLFPRAVQATLVGDRHEVCTKEGPKDMLRFPVDTGGRIGTPYILLL